MTALWVVLAAMAGGTLGVIVTAALAAGTQTDAVQDARRQIERQMLDALQHERAEASRWRDRALLCESNGPTVGDVDEVFRENVRLKAELAVLKERLNGPPPLGGSAKGSS